MMREGTGVRKGTNTSVSDEMGFFSTRWRAQ